MLLSLHHPRRNLRRPEFFPGWLLPYVRGQPLYLSLQVRWCYINDLYLEKENFHLPLLYVFHVVVLILFLLEINHVIRIISNSFWLLLIAILSYFITYIYL